VSLVVFAHLLGCAMWIGGWMAGVVFTSSVADEPPQVRAGVFRIVGRLHTMVIGFGALLVVGTGVVLVMNMDAGGWGALIQDAKLWVMVLSGLVGGLLVIFVGLPTATRVAALAVVTKTGGLPPALETYRKRLDLVSAIAGGLAVVALLSWYLL
jgi:hypothetical protein